MPVSISLLFNAAHFFHHCSLATVPQSLSSSFVVSCPRNLFLGSCWERYRIGSCRKTASEGTSGSCHMAAAIPKQPFIRHATLVSVALSVQLEDLWHLMGADMKAKVLKWDVSFSRMHSQLEVSNWVIKIRRLECWCDGAATIRVNGSQRSRGAVDRKWGCGKKEAEAKQPDVKGVWMVWMWWESYNTKRLKWWNDQQMKLKLKQLTLFGYNSYYYIVFLYDYFVPNQVIWRCFFTL